MSSKILNKPVIFHVMGVPGSGKSWFSRNLSKQLNAMHIDSERIRFELFESQTYSRDEEIVVENMVDYFSQIAINNRANIVIDGTSSSQKRRKEILRLAEKNEYEHVLVWLQANEELCKVRSTAASDTSVSSFKRKLNSDQFADLAIRLEKPAENENPVVVSGGHSFRAQLKSIVTRLNSMGLISISPSKAKKPTSTEKVSVVKEESNTKEKEKIVRRNTQRVSG